MTKKLIAPLVVGLLLALTIPTTADEPAAQEPRIKAGLDLFNSVSDRTFYGAIHFKGVAGCPILPQATHTDTIVERLADATPSNPTVPIVARCLQLEAEYIDVAGQQVPVSGIYATLQSDRGRHPSDPPAGPDSTGTVTFRFNQADTGGTFDSVLDVHFDIRQGSINGPIVYSSDQFSSPHFTSTNTVWSRVVPVGGGGFNDAATLAGPIEDQHGVVAPSDLIPGVNVRVNGVDSSWDFYPDDI